MMNFLNSSFFAYLKEEKLIGECVLLADINEGQFFQEQIHSLQWDEENLIKGFQDFYGYPYYDLLCEQKGKMKLQLPLEWYEKNLLLPVEKTEGILCCAIGKPISQDEAKQLSEALGEKVKFVLADEVLIRNKLFSDYYPNIYREKTYGNLTISYDLLSEEKTEKLDDIDYYIQRLIKDAWGRKASDIHLGFRENKFTILMRVDGILEHYADLDENIHSSMINKIKILSDLDIAEKRLPQEGHFVVKQDQDMMDIRVATIGLYRGEKVVLRLLPHKRQYQSLKNLDFSEDNLDKVTRILEGKQGLVLVTGPTSSGKTTTLYAMLEHLKKQTLVIYSVEDPIEAHIDGVNQIQVNVRGGLDFALSLRGVLRQDPDIILIGEIRDMETAQIAIRAALTGHLVLASLHIPYAQAAIERMDDLGVNEELFSTTVRAVIGQRLLVKRCAYCSAEDSSIQDICQYCHGSKKSGRIAVHEVWLPEEEDRIAIRENQDSLTVRRNNRQKGFLTMWDDAHSKAEEGKLDLDLKENRWFKQEVL